MLVIRWILQSLMRFGAFPLSLVVAHVIAHFTTKIYLRWPHLDIPMHVAGGVAIGIFFWGAFSLPEAKQLFGDSSLRMRAIIAMGWVGMAAALWELVEWVFDLIGLVQSQASVDDTMLDLTLGLTGGTMAVLARYAVGKRS